jgi:hypothetical protein
MEESSIAEQPHLQLRIRPGNGLASAFAPFVVLYTTPGILLVMGAARRAALGEGSHEL